MRLQQALARGNIVRRNAWHGYWEYVVEDGKDKIYMHCADGKVLEVRDTDDILFTLRNACADDWVVMEKGEIL